MTTRNAAMTRVVLAIVFNAPALYAAARAANRPAAAIGGRKRPARDVEIRAVQKQAALLNRRADKRKGHQVRQAVEDCGLLEPGQVFRRRVAGRLAVQRGSDRGGGGGDQRHPLADEVARRKRRLVRREGADPAAACVTEHDDMLDAQPHDGEFERRRDAVREAAWRIGRHEVGDVAHDKELAGAGVENDFRRHPGIAAADNHDFRPLPGFGQGSVTFLFGSEPPAAEIAVALDQALGEIHDILEREGTRQRLIPRVSTQKRQINDLPRGAAPVLRSFRIPRDYCVTARCAPSAPVGTPVATASTGDYVRCMRYLSTRDAGPAPALRSFDEVLLAGLAEDGGLYVPERLPAIGRDALCDLAGLPYAELAARIVGLFAAGSFALDELRALAARAYGGFAHAAVAPLVQLDERIWLLELFHGPTLAFKDLALQLVGLMFDSVWPGAANM